MSDLTEIHQELADELALLRDYEAEFEEARIALEEAEEVYVRRKSKVDSSQGKIEDLREELRESEDTASAAREMRGPTP